MYYFATLHNDIVLKHYCNIVSLLAVTRRKQVKLSHVQVFVTNIYTYKAYKGRLT